MPACVSRRADRPVLWATSLRVDAADPANAAPEEMETRADPPADDADPPTYIDPANVPLVPVPAMVSDPDDPGLAAMMIEPADNAPPLVTEALAVPTSAIVNALVVSSVVEDPSMLRLPVAQNTSQQHRLR